MLVLFLLVCGWAGKMLDLFTVCLGANASLDEESSLRLFQLSILVCVLHKGSIFSRGSLTQWIH